MQVLVHAVVPQCAENVFPRHNVAYAAASDHCLPPLFVELLVKKMAAISFNVEHHHGGEHWAHNGSFKPTHFVFRNKMRCVAQYIVVAQPKRNDVRRESKRNLTIFARRDPTITADLILALLALEAWLYVSRAAHDE